MKVAQHFPREYADAIKGLLPPGAAWDWPAGGVGDSLLLGTAQELARVDADTQAALDAAIEAHRPGKCNFHISEYRRVAGEAVASVAEAMPRKAAVIGCRIGTRLWSHAAPTLTFPIDLARVDHLFGPARVGNGHGSRIGDRLWGHKSRYVLRVRYYRSVVNPKVLWDALKDFKQAHVFLWFEDISGVGGEVSYGQD